MHKVKLVVIATALAGAGTFATAAMAKHNDNTRPGWGHGDKNHEHTGPPGQSVRPDRHDISVHNDIHQDVRGGDANNNGDNNGDAVAGNASATASQSTTASIGNTTH